MSDTQLTLVSGPTLDISPADAATQVREIADGIVEVSVSPPAGATARVTWRIPCVDAVAYWTPDSGRHRGLPPNWSRPHTAALQSGAPVASLVGSGDKSLCTFAAAEKLEPVRIRAGAVEETGDYEFGVEQQGKLTLRIDLSGRLFSHTLADVAAWWQAASPVPAVPRVVRMPAYSTWYSMHQHVNAVDVERQAELAHELGCDSIIVDDGWMTTDRTRGYGHTGEWEPAPSTFPDMAAHVAKVRQGGLAYMLWYAPPFVGRHSSAWQQLEPYALRKVERLDAMVVDPRYPVVRDYLVGKLAIAVEDWGMDGLKIDFIDQFAVEDAPEPGPEADCTSVTEGVRRLFVELDARLRRTIAQPLIEFRQPYVSPGLWPYASMVRAGDCPLSPLKNRQSTVDLRLVSGPIAVHADMMMWHAQEPPEQVAVHLINALFSVPQISVDLAAQTPEQRATLAFWLGFFREHADVLQGGVFEPERPDLMYPVIKAYDEHTVIAATYAPMPIRIPSGRWERLLVANADAAGLVMLMSDGAGTASAKVLDCQGRLVGEQQVELNLGVHTLAVPTGGLLRLDRTPS